MSIDVKSGLFERVLNLAKPDDGLDESPTVMVGEATTKNNSEKRGILKPSWAFVEKIN